MLQQLEATTKAIVAQSQTGPGFLRSGFTGSLTDCDNLPPPALIAQKIVQDLKAALAQFKLIPGDLEEQVPQLAV